MKKIVLLLFVVHHWMVTTARVLPETVVPENLAEIQQALWNSPKTTKVSVGGAYYSMGGQTGRDQQLHFDMHRMNRILHLDQQARIVIVEAGITWAQLQRELDRHDLSVSNMQSYNSFSVGGSVSVNAHGRYLGFGPLISTVESLTLVLSNGLVVNASRTKNDDLFRAAIGGYGGLGIVVHVELHVTDNCPLELDVSTGTLSNYQENFKRHVQPDMDVVLHNAQVDLATLTWSLTSITWKKTRQRVTVPDRLQPTSQPSSSTKTVLTRIVSRWIPTSLDSFFRPQFIQGQVVWKNYEASYDVALLEGLNPYELQEFFVPVWALETFLMQLKQIVQRHNIRIWNISIRHSNADSESILAWAKTECFSIVLFYPQSRFAETRVWSSELIQVALDLHGSFYLPYRMYAEPQQVRSAYPNLDLFFRIKRKWDPDSRMHSFLEHLAA